MIIKNLTSKPIIVAMRSVKGFDDRIEQVEPGEASDTWLSLEIEDVITIEEV